MRTKCALLWIVKATVLVQILASPAVHAQITSFGFVSAPDRFSERVASELSVRMQQQLGVGHIEPVRLDTFGSIANAVDALRFGKLSLMLLPVSALESTVPELGVLGLPLLFRSAERASVAAKGRLGDRLKTLVKAKLDVEIIGFLWRVGTFASNRCLSHPNDLKGLKIADGPSWYQLLLNVSGANAFVIASSEVPLALQRGAVDGVLFVIEVISDAGVMESAKCLTGVSRDQFMILPQVILASKDAMTELSARRSELASIVDQRERENLTSIARQAAELEKLYGTRGNQIASFGDAERKTWDEVRDRVNREFDSKVPGGAELRQLLEDAR
jgi:TRAP-type C4-dicarboxylate transport system substrate-binding protein